MVVLTVHMGLGTEKRNKIQELVQTEVLEQF
jgi:hypothetical protein